MVFKSVCNNQLEKTDILDLRFRLATSIVIIGILFGAFIMVFLSNNSKGIPKRIGTLSQKLTSTSSMIQSTK
jgi:hypothetical protein